jgi:hypothetical protein
VAFAVHLDAPGRQYAPSRRPLRGGAAMQTARGP